jgi:ligand-binding sensor domain-containing protein/signal transduction histidine kinase
LQLACAMVFALLTTYVRADQPQYTRTVWRVQDGLPEGTVQALAQTPDGYMWIGTTGGLTRFDGTHFALYGSGTPSAGGVNSVFCLAATHDGSLWIGTDGGGLLHLEHGQMIAYGPTEGLSDGFVRAIFEDGRGTVWVGTDNGLFRIAPGARKAQRVEITAAMAPLGVHAITADHTGRIWVGGSRLLSIDDGRQRFYALPGSYSSNRVKSLLESADGTIWVGMVNGLERLRGDRFERVAAISGTVRSLKQTRDGTVWIGTIGNGLWTYKAGAFAQLSGLLPSQTVLNILEDTSNQVWLGLQAGLVRLSRTSVHVVPLPGGTDADFGTISGNGDGSLWVVNSSVFRIQDGIARPYRFAELPGIAVRNVFHDRDGNLWVGTDGNGAFHITRHGTVHYSAPRELTNNFIRVFLETRRGEVWIGTDEGLNFVNAAGVHRLTMKDGLVYSSIRSLLEDRAGDVWVGTEQGLGHWHAGGFEEDPATEGLRHEKVWSIYEDHTGALWFGTRDHGLFRFEGGRLTHFTTAQGLASNSIYQILEDPGGRMWLSGPDTISAVEEAGLHEEPDSAKLLSVSLYTMPYEAEDAQFYGGRQPSGYVAPDGTVWFPSSKGPAHIVLAEPATPTVPRVFIQRVTLDGRDLPLSGTIQLSAQMTRLEFSYAPLSLGPGEAIRYQYRLRNFDKNWVYAGTSLTASYTNLPAGRYRFEVQAFDTAKPDLTSMASVELWRAQYFWQTWWFLSLLATTLVLVGWASYRIRMHQVRLRFRAVLDERGRLAREMHDTVIQGCTGVSVLLEAVASRETEVNPVQQDLLRHARDQVRTTIIEARHAVWNLRHDDGEAIDLSSSIQAIATQTVKEFGVPVSPAVEGEAFFVPSTISRELLMVVREAVYDAALHGQPKTISITTRYESRRLSVLVVDDGVGFDTASVPAAGHYGIIGMRERMKRVSGDFHLHSEPGKGTRAELSVARSILESRNPQAAWR